MHSKSFRIRIHLNEDNNWNNKEQEQTYHTKQYISEHYLFLKAASLSKASEKKKLLPLATGG